MDNFSSEQAQQALQQAKMQMAQQQTQMLVSTVTAKCFDKCVTSPSSSLSKREETCLAMCFDKFIQVQQVVIKSMS
jgi:mitochondrial import inner membrane translocase subunit TIM13